MTTRHPLSGIPLKNRALAVAIAVALAPAAVLAQEPAASPATAGAQTAQT